MLFIGSFFPDNKKTKKEMRKKFPPKFDSVPSIFSLFFPLYNSPNDPNLSKGTLWKPKLKRRLFPESAFIFSRSLPSNEFYYWPQFSSRLLFSSQVCNLLGNLTKFKAEWGGVSYDKLTSHQGGVAKVLVPSRDKNITVDR